MGSDAGELEYRKRLVVNFTPGDRHPAARVDDTVKMTSTIAAKL